ncbi:MAG: hypothetical protein ABR530_08815, partial [Pyrinomonadaceae bacterium]
MRKSFTSLAGGPVLLLATTLMIVGCGTAGSGAGMKSVVFSGGETEAQTQPTHASRLTAADVAKLKWIIGDWRGSGENQKPFFERYRFENENTLA